MLRLQTHKKFEKDFQRDSQNGFYNDEAFRDLASIIDTLLAQESLEPKYKNHRLKGEWRDFRECHIRPDWLLVYRVDQGAQTLTLIRLGSHNQIFNQ